MWLWELNLVEYIIGLLTTPIFKFFSSFSMGGGTGAFFTFVHVLTTHSFRTTLKSAVIAGTLAFMATGLYMLNVEWGVQTLRTEFICSKAEACKNTPEELKHEVWFRHNCDMYMNDCRRWPFDRAVELCLLSLLSNMKTLGTNVYDKLGWSCVLATLGLIAWTRFIGPYVKEKKKKNERVRALMGKREIQHRAELALDAS